MKKPVRVDALTPAMLKKHPIWEFLPESADRDEAFVTVVERLPVRTLSNRLVATDLTLNNGKIVLALLGNIDLRDPDSNDHFLTVAVFDGRGRRFDLARYHDVDFKTRGPKQLASFLRLKVSEVFPMSYDVTPVARGAESCRKGTVRGKVSKRLSHQQLIALALP
jgi:hypothetical protein